jgi:hypothetical protein
VRKEKISFIFSKRVKISNFFINKVIKIPSLGKGEREKFLFHFPIERKGWALTREGDIKIIHLFKGKNKNV